MFLPEDGATRGRLIRRDEFRRVLLKVVRCICSELDVPGVTPCTPEEIAFWMSQVTEEDIQAVWEEVKKE